MSIRPRELAYRGAVSAAAFLFRVEHIGEAEACRRILALWKPGAEVYRLGADLLLRLPEPYPVRCDLAPGLPLLPLSSHPRLLSAAPLTTLEIEDLDLSAAAVVLISGGVAQGVSLSRDQLVEPATWLDLEGWSCQDATSLGARVAAVQDAVEPVTFEARRRLAGVPEPHPELARVAAALRGERPAEEAGGGAVRLQEAARRLLSTVNARIAQLGQVFQSHPGDGAERTASPRSVTYHAAPNWLSSLLHLLADGARLGRLFGRGSGAADGHARGNRQPEPPGPPPAPERTPWDALRHLAARLTMHSQLGRLLGRRQEQYLARMMAMFERGDLNDALRHAIPLGGGTASGEASPALWAPAPRADLTLSPHLSASGSALYAVTDLFEHLKRLYRAAFERLRDQGRIDEAAFVLAELLHENEEAVAFLERHGKLRLAAEMAEGRELPTGLVVRQWWLAGERERAVLIARRSQAWGDALVRLEQSDPEQAQQLRVMWGELLAAAGDFAQAVTVVWPVEEDRNLALGWIDQVIALGGVPAAQALPRKLALAPELAGDIRSAIAALLAQPGPEGAWVRHALAEALRTGEKSPQARSLARATVRALARDLAAGDGPSTPEEIKKLVSFSADDALRTDLPPLTEPTRTSLAGRPEPLVYRVEAGDGGVHRVFDAAYLSNGRCVAALGEAGVRLLSREGKTVAHFDQPAHRLVVSDHEDRVIALAERGGVYRLAQIDLQARTVRAWCEAELTAFAETFDGATWLVGTGKDFVSLDAMSTRLESLWRTRDVGRVTAIGRRTDRASLLLVKAGTAGGLWPDAADEEDWERWNYELPSLVLRHRLPLEWSPNDYSEGHCAVAANGATAQLAWLLPDDPENVELKLLVEGIAVTLDGSELLRLEPGLLDAFPLDVALAEEWITVIRGSNDGITCWVASKEKRRVRAEIYLEGARAARMRLHPNHLTLCDDRGRVLVLELGQGQLLRNLRTR